LLREQLLAPRRKFCAIGLDLYSLYYYTKPVALDGLAGDLAERLEEKGPMAQSRDCKSLLVQGVPGRPRLWADVRMPPHIASQQRRASCL
jgi:hypothetical protein